MERGQAVQELRFRILRGVHHGAVDLVRAQQFDAVAPDVVRFAHRHPYVRVDKVAVAYAVDAVRHGNPGARGLRQFAAGFHQRRVRGALRRGDGSEIHTHFRRRDHQRIGHVVVRVAQKAQFHFGQRLLRMFAHRQHVGQRLRRVKFIGQAVPYRNARVFGQRVHDVLPVSAVFDSVVDAPQHAGRVFQRLFFTHLRTGGAQIGDPCALIVGRHFERTARPRRVFLEQQHDIFALERFFLFPDVLVRFQPCGQIQQITDLPRREVEERQQTSFT